LLQISLHPSYHLHCQTQTKAYEYLHTTNSSVEMFSVHEQATVHGCWFAKQWQESSHLEHSHVRSFSSSGAAAGCLISVGWTVDPSSLLSYPKFVNGIMSCTPVVACFHVQSCITHRRQCKWKLILLRGGFLDVWAPLPFGTWPQ